MAQTRVRGRGQSRPRQAQRAIGSHFILFHPHEVGSLTHFIDGTWRRLVIGLRSHSRSVLEEEPHTGLFDYGAPALLKA